MTIAFSVLRGLVVSGAWALGVIPTAWAQAAAADSSAEWMQALVRLRTNTCPNATEAPLRPVSALNDAARRVASGIKAASALEAAGYRAVRTVQVQLGGHPSIAAVEQTLQRNYCEALTRAQLSEAGAYRQGDSWWFILAAPFSPPAASAAGDVAVRVLELTNQARAKPQRCGSEGFAPAPPLKANALLDRAAGAHSQEMARHSFMAHEGRDGSKPSERISRAGYRWRSIGENVAAGQTTADEVVRDWLRSPEHCVNLMSPRFAEMGIAYAVNPASESGIYWTQTFGRPR